jgi:DDE superfamily endonuclease/Helix-turn-helix of DDE superfamily endonuclease
MLFILVYFKTYTLQVVHGRLFDLSQSRANRLIHELTPILQRALDILGVVPKRDPKQLSKSKTAKARVRGQVVDLVIDGTDRERQRPKNKVEQTLHYSGKHKTHTDKNLVVVNRKTTRIEYLSQTYPGTAHDKKIADHEAIAYPSGTRLFKDTGFQGYEPDAAKGVVSTHQPQKSRATAN